MTVAASAGMAKTLTSKAVGGDHFDVVDEGGKAFVTGGVDGALTAMLPGLGKALEGSFASAMGLSAEALAADLTVGVIKSAELGIEKNHRKGNLRRLKRRRLWRIGRSSRQPRPDRHRRTSMAQWHLEYLDDLRACLVARCCLGRRRRRRTWRDWRRWGRSGFAGQHQ